MNTFERMDHQRLTKAVKRIRTRWRVGVALRGAAIVLVTGFVSLVALAGALDYLRYRPWALFAFSAVTYGLLLYLAIRFLVMPLSTRVSDDRVALYVGEALDERRAELASAVEMSDADKVATDDSVSDAFARELVSSAVHNLHTIDFGRGVERQRLRRFSSLLAAAGTFVLVAAIMSPAFLRIGAPLLFMPWAQTAFANPYAIDVLPGDVQIARGADQLIEASLVGFDSDRIEVGLRSEGGDWERWPMAINEDTQLYSFLAFDLNRNTEYFVEAAGVRSSIHTIEVVDLPYVDTMALEFYFPDYSGLDPLTIEDGGDIAVLYGTRVHVVVTPTVEVPAGRLAFELDAEDPEGEPENLLLDLTAAGDGTFTGTFTIERDGYYRVELQGFNGVMGGASPDYFIEALTDQAPAVSFDTPGRDTQVSPLDEAYVEVIADDDYGVTHLELIYTINGGEEQTISLFSAPSAADARQDLSAGYTFYLEEEDLVPGDFVAYYARAYDNQASGDAQATTTDIYFMEVRPLDRTFRQAQQGGGGGGGGGGGQQQDTAFAQRQRQIVAATFRLVRDKDSFSQTQIESDLGTLALNQSRLREQVELVLGRTAQRGAMSPDSDFQKMAEYLQSGIAEMIPAEEELGRFAPEAALPPEQRALQHLQRAEALMRDVQVSFGGGGGGGGGGGQQEQLNEELADLLDLEMEKLRNQYEQVQRGEQQQVDNEVDEALQRLEELARRQQQENERQRRLANLPRNQSGGGGGGNQRQLAEEAEELARRLERLSREQAEPQLQELSRQLQEAADSMRRAAASNDDRSLAEGLSALNRLQDARDELQGEQSRRLQRDLEDVQNRIDQLQQAQEKIAEDVRQLGADAMRGGADRERLNDQMQRVLERKDELSAQIADLEDQIDGVARENRRDQRDAARKLQETANWMRDSKLSDKVRYSKGVAQQRLGAYAEQFENQITNDLDRLGEMVSEAAGLVENNDQNRLSSSLDDTRDLIRGLESLAERAEQGLERQGQQGEQQGQQGEQQGQQGEQGQGQQGEQGEQGQGQQGQQGQGQQGQQGQGQQGQQGQGQQGQQGQGQQGQQDQQGQRGGGGGNRGGNRSGGSNWAGDARNFGDWDDERRQYAAEYDRRLNDAQDLRNRLAEEGAQVTDLDDILGEMRDWEFDGTPRGIDELRDQVIENLKLFEYALRRLADGAGAKMPSLADSDEVPEGYRKQVEEYFRSLGRAGGQQQR